MKWIAEIKTPEQLRGVIEHDEFAGYYLYIYEGDNTRCTWDHLQDTLEIAMRQAWEDFGVPLDAWRRVE